MLLLPLLSHFSRVRLCATPQTAAYQAPPSLGFSRQEHWSGLPFPSPMHESESEVAQSCPTLSDRMDCSLPGSSVHGIFQAEVLEWGAIAFSVFTGCMAELNTNLTWLLNSKSLTSEQTFISLLTPINIPQTCSFPFRHNIFFQDAKGSFKN